MPRLLPPGMLVTVAPVTVMLSGRLTVTLIGTPLRAFMIAPTRQPPVNAPVPGIWYTSDPLNVCGMSCGLIPYSESKSNVFWVVAASFDPCVVPLLREYW